MGNISNQTILARELIARLDEAQDHRSLSAAEVWLRRELNRAYLGLASLERSIARQRAKIACMHQGDTNTAFFKIHATHRRQKNKIHGLLVEGVQVTEEQDMARVAFEHFSAVLCLDVQRQFTLDLQEFDPRFFDLTVLEVPFSPEEIWDGIRKMPSGKGPGPDSFTA